MKIVGLFPAFSAENYGGIEQSGYLAWEAIRACEPDARLFQHTGDAKGNPPSRGKSVWKALSGEWRADLVIVWHLHLLKLLPFLRTGAADVTLYLHGVEAWRSHDWLTRRMLDRVTLLTSNSQYTMARFLRYEPRLRRTAQRIVPLGIGTSLPNHCVPPGEVPAALMLGRMDRAEDYKGHREMICAWPRVLRRIPRAQLWIAGGGNLKPELEQLVHHMGLSGSVRFLGRVSPEEKESLLQQCRCLALPSRGEGFGLVYLEAMRYGRPCLVSACDAGREVVCPPRCGLDVDPSNAYQIAEAVCRLLTSGPEWDAWSRTARARYEAKFTARHFQERLQSMVGRVPRERRAA